MRRSRFLFITTLLCSLNAHADFFSDLTREAMRKKSLLCVGLDPQVKSEKTDPKELADLALQQSVAIVDATKEHAIVYKLNIAFFLAHGSAGISAMEKLLTHLANEKLLVILDGKFGDIDNTAKAYAQAAFKTWKVGAITVNPLMGYDTIAPYMEYEGAAVFMLAKTSNKGSKDFQELSLQSGTTMFSTLASKGAEWNEGHKAFEGAKGRVGLVVGATDPEAVRQVRALAPHNWILAPGVGAQGGKLGETLAHGVRSAENGGLGVLIAVSREVANAANPEMKARELKDAIAEYVKF